MRLKQPEEVNTLARGCASNLMADLKDKFMALVKKDGSTPYEFAAKYQISSEDVNSILRGVSLVSVRTFLKILVLSDHVIDVKDIKETLRQGVVPPPPMPPRPGFAPRFPHAGGFRHAPQPGRPMEAPTRPTRPKTSAIPEWHEFDNDGDGDEFDDVYGDHMEPIDFDEAPAAPASATPPTPPFRTMSRDELVDIIEDKLWSSEIDVENASKAELVRFLEEKDRMHKMVASRKQRNEVSEEKLEELKDHLADAVKANPHLQKQVEKLLGLE